MSGQDQKPTQINSTVSFGGKPPAGYVPVPGSKFGGWRKRVGSKWVYWYPSALMAAPFAEALEKNKKSKTAPNLQAIADLKKMHPEFKGFTAKQAATAIASGSPQQWLEGLLPNLDEDYLFQMGSEPLLFGDATGAIVSVADTKFFSLTHNASYTVKKWTGPEEGWSITRTLADGSKQVADGVHSGLLQGLMATWVADGHTAKDWKGGTGEWFSEQILFSGPEGVKEVVTAPLMMKTALVKDKVTALKQVQAYARTAVALTTVVAAKLVTLAAKVPHVPAPGTGPQLKTKPKPTKPSEVTPQDVIDAAGSVDADQKLKVAAEKIQAATKLDLETAKILAATEAYAKDLGEFRKGIWQSARDLAKKHVPTSSHIKSFSAESAESKKHMIYGVERDFIKSPLGRKLLDKLNLTKWTADTSYAEFLSSPLNANYSGADTYAVRLAQRVAELKALNTPMEEKYSMITLGADEIKSIVAPMMPAGGYGVTVQSFTNSLARILKDGLGLTGNHLMSEALSLTSVGHSDRMQKRAKQTFMATPHEINAATDMLLSTSKLHYDIERYNPIAGEDLKLDEPKRGGLWKDLLKRGGLTTVEDMRYLNQIALFRIAELNASGKKGKTITEHRRVWEDVMRNLEAKINDVASQPVPPVVRAAQAIVTAIGQQIPAQTARVMNSVMEDEVRDLETARSETLGVWVPKFGTMTKHDIQEHLQRARAATFDGEVDAHIYPIVKEHFPRSRAFAYAVHADLVGTPEEVAAFARREILGTPAKISTYASQSKVLQNLTGTLKYFPEFAAVVDPDGNFHAKAKQLFEPHYDLAKLRESKVFVEQTLARLKSLHIEDEMERSITENAKLADTAYKATETVLAMVQAELDQIERDRPTARGALAAGEEIKVAIVTTLEKHNRERAEALTKLADIETRAHEADATMANYDPSNAPTLRRGTEGLDRFRDAVSKLMVSAPENIHHKTTLGSDGGRYISTDFGLPDFTQDFKEKLVVAARVIKNAPATESRGMLYGIGKAIAVEYLKTQGPITAFAKKHGLDLDAVAHIIGATNALTAGHVVAVHYPDIAAHDALNDKENYARANATLTTVTTYQDKHGKPPAPLPESVWRFLKLSETTLAGLTSGMVLPIEAPVSFSDKPIEVAIGGAVALKGEINHNVMYIVHNPQQGLDVQAWSQWPDERETVMSGSYGIEDVHRGSPEQHPVLKKIPGVGYLSKSEMTFVILRQLQQEEKAVLGLEKGGALQRLSDTKWRLENAWALLASEYDRYVALGAGEPLFTETSPEPADNVLDDPTEVEVEVEVEATHEAAETPAKEAMEKGWASKRSQQISRRLAEYEASRVGGTVIEPPSEVEKPPIHNQLQALMRLWEARGLDKSEAAPQVQHLIRAGNYRKAVEIMGDMFKAMNPPPGFRPLASVHGAWIKVVGGEAVQYWKAGKFFTPAVFGEQFMGEFNPENKVSMKIFASATLDNDITAVNGGVSATSVGEDIPAGAEAAPIVQRKIMVRIPSDRDIPMLDGVTVQDMFSANGGGY